MASRLSYCIEGHMEMPIWKHQQPKDPEASGNLEMAGFATKALNSLDQSSDVLSLLSGRIFESTGAISNRTL